MTVLKVEMRGDGTADVMLQHSGRQHWSEEALDMAIAEMGICCASRRGIPDNCPCLACSVGKVARRWRMGENARQCQGCRMLDGEHDFGPTCTLTEAS